MAGVSSPFQRHALRQAAAALGGEAQLCQLLGVAAADLSRWLRERQAPIPDAVSRKVVNLLADIEAGLSFAPPDHASAQLERPVVPRD
jgi:hypothetical protein